MLITSYAGNITSTDAINRELNHAIERANFYGTRDMLAKLKVTRDSGFIFGTRESVKSENWLLDTGIGALVWLPPELGCEVGNVVGCIHEIIDHEDDTTFSTYVRNADYRGVRRYYVCNSCGEIHYGSPEYSYNDCSFCSDSCVYDFDLSICENCGAVTDDVVEVRDEDGYHSSWCSDCAYGYAYFCDNCNEYVTRDAWNYDADYCCSCAPSDEHPALRSYGYDPVWECYGDTCNNAYPVIGVELETDTNEYGARYTYIDDLLSGRAANRTCYTEDSSLDHGVEITSHPMTLDEHIACGLWEDIAEIAKKHGFTSHDNGRCGLHLHINVSFFGKNRAVQEVAAYKLVRIFSRFKTALVNFSRRTELSWCSFNYTDNAKFELPKKASLHTGKGASLFEQAKTLKNNNRGHSMVWNFQHDTTFECRLFRGTLNLDTLYASMLLVQGVARYVKTHSVVACESIDWYALMTWIINDAENEVARDAFVRYLNKRGLYTNEDVA